jgi:hypothetical protein
MGNAFPHVFDPRRRRAAFSAVLSIGSPDRKSAGTSRVVEMPVIIGEPSGIRTLANLIKSHFGHGGIEHHRAESAAITQLRRLWPVSILRVA